LAKRWQTGKFGKFEQYCRVSRYVRDLGTNQPMELGTDQPTDRRGKPIG